VALHWKQEHPAVGKRAVHVARHAPENIVEDQNPIISI
jgi:hypothetical protein